MITTMMVTEISLHQHDHHDMQRRLGLMYDKVRAASHLSQCLISSMVACLTRTVGLVAIRHGDDVFC
jgi:hypothetical protein